MIVGGGRITYYLTRMLLELGMTVKIIELNKDKCINLVEKFPLGNGYSWRWNGS